MLEDDHGHAGEKGQHSFGPVIEGNPEEHVPVVSLTLSYLANETASAFQAGLPLTVGLFGLIVP